MHLNNNLSELVSIGIATKNRWQDLEITLTKIAQKNFKALEIIIYDDFSTYPCPFDLEKFNLNIKIKRFAVSLGYIARRNQLAKAIRTKYYFSLDDDSYPVGASLIAAVEFAENCSDLFCLSFPIYNPTRNKYENSSSKQEPYQVRSFIGCGHLLHRERFLQLGGYREELVHQGEEMEIAARAFQDNLYCYHFPSFLVHHTASNEGRNWWRMDFYGSRNIVLWNDWFVPQKLKLIKQIRTLISRLILSCRVFRPGLIQGEYIGLKEIYKYKKYRQNMSIQNYQRWRNFRSS
ncbi:putative glycosyltransferase [Xenococcus sp. PCC 7305]|uniref:glycosyltransferase family 2 protein n=1 Tax=Xenococcus sp. PCC 7305 TaxID=102125 RepID=UPI0002AC673E|nr:glycosyltransferase [Xenococcus sp. PCC 7305]ELS02160.1 putative glycosyltransferase [Xenococcus sp. PCC 7305]